MIRVCIPHKIQAVETFKSLTDDSEYDLCPECLEAFQLLVSGAFFADVTTDDTKKRGRPRKEATA